MAGRAADSLVDVNAVIEIDIVGEAMNLDPFNGLIGPGAFPDRFEIADVIEENGMAIHAGLGGRDAGVGGRFHAGVTVPTIDAVIADVVFVAELDGLLASDALVGDVRRARNQQDTRQGKSAKRNGREQTKLRNEIYTAMKNLCHVSGAPEGQPLRHGENRGRFDHSYAGQRVSGSDCDPTVSNKTYRNATSFPGRTAQ